MQNLNKENFWKNVELAFPDAFKVFSEWIDKYKEEVGWHELFATTGRLSVYSQPAKYPKEIKFHDLPFEFQNGILARFDIECHHGIVSGNGKKTYEQICQNEPRRISHLFADLQNQININNK